MRHFPATLTEMFASLWRNWELTKASAKREVLGRYRGSVLGLMWSFFNPLFMLAVFTFVFSFIFQARWGGGSGSKPEFALVLFAGLIIFNLFAECINRAPGLILSNPNYVKKIVFPLEILPFVGLLSALFHALISLAVWLIAYALFIGIPSPVMIALTGCIAGFLVFLYYNAPPARVFMGDVGALPIGALLGFIVWSLGIYSGPRLVGPLTVVSGMMIIELVPVPIQVAYFKAAGKRIFPRTPVHHAFQHAGWPETRVTMMFVLAQCLLVWIGVLWAYGSVQEFVR